MDQFKASNRMDALDSIRGLASLFVLLGHLLGSFEWNHDFTRIPFIRSIFDGRTAVTMFFILSGFVLTFNQVAGPRKTLSIIPFYCRRLTRIWIPWFVIFLISLLFKEHFRFSWPETTPAPTVWIRSFWQGSSGTSEILKQLIFQLHDASTMMIPQDWSLGIELRASILIPLLILAARYHWILLALIGIMFEVLKPTSGYLYLTFVLGVFTAMANSRIASSPGWKSKGIWFLVVGVILYQGRWAAEVFDLSPRLVSEGQVWITTALGCMCILLAALNSNRFRKFLEHPVFVFLGRISYSLYLVQMIVLICFAPRLVLALNQMGMRDVGTIQLLVFFIVCTFTIGVATLCERYIEAPCIWLGKRVTQRLETNRFINRIRA